jgi:hypothetical protein
MIVLVLIGSVVAAALIVAYWPGRRPRGSSPIGLYRGTPVEWPARR